MFCLPWACGDGSALNPHPPRIFSSDLVKNTCTQAGVESVSLMLRSHSGCRPAPSSGKWVECLDVKQSLILLEIWEKPKEGRDGSVLQQAC